MNKHICHVRVRHVSVSMVLSALCLLSSVISSSFPVLWSHSHSHGTEDESSDALWSLCKRLDSRLNPSLPLSVCLLQWLLLLQRQEQVCLPPVLPPLLPVPLSLQYGSSVWEAAIPLFSRPLHLFVPLWVPSLLCPPLPVDGTGSKSLWYFALGALSKLRSVTQAFCVFPPWTELTILLQTAAILLLLLLPVCCLCWAQTKSNPASSVCQYLRPASVFVLQC